MPARISFYRPTGQSRRQARSAHDHDVFEGLPVRRWSRQWVAVGKSAPPPPPQPELPLPKETHLLQPMSQALLQAARSSSSTQAKPPPKPPVTPGGRLFMTKRWVRVPRNKEGPEPVYLAKVPDRPRKRGDVEVVEVIETTAVAQVRRRVPPPKRKAKPRGRKPGPKKTVSFAEERLRTFPVVVPHNSDPNALGGPTPGGVPLDIPGEVAAATTTTATTTTAATAATVAAAAGVDTEMTDVDAANKEEEVVPVSDGSKEIEMGEIKEEVVAPVVAPAPKVDELPKKPVVTASPSTERKAHPLPPRPAGLPPKPVGAANLVDSKEPSAGGSRDGAKA